MKLFRFRVVQHHFSDNDLTGSILDSNNPIAVISGHQCANSPGSYCGRNL